MGAAFDDELITQVATVIATEARAFNNANRTGLDVSTKFIWAYLTYIDFVSSGLPTSILLGILGGDEARRLLVKMPTTYLLTSRASLQVYRVIQVTLTSVWSPRASILLVMISRTGTATFVTRMMSRSRSRNL